MRLEVIRQKNKEQKLLLMQHELEANISELKQSLQALGDLTNINTKTDDSSKLTESLIAKLPFYTSSHNDDDSDRFRWERVEGSIWSQNANPSILYLVKIKSLLDDRVYFKLGVTTLSVEERFEKSTQVELVEIISALEFSNYLALFLEYIFIKEFKLTAELADALQENTVSIKFSGFTEIVRPNSISKITHLLSKTKELEPHLIKTVETTIANANKTKGKLAHQSYLNRKIAEYEAELIINSKELSTLSRDIAKLKAELSPAKNHLKQEAQQAKKTQSTHKWV